MNISRRHARIFYDFQRRRFALEVLGRNGCYVEGVLHVPGHPPIKLDSQDRLEIGDKEFYFLLPVRSILGGPIGPRNHGNVYQTVMYGSDVDTGENKQADVRTYWMPMEKLHSELVEQFSYVWHHSRVRKYLTPEDHSGQESQGKPWFGLLALLKKYPEHFVINTRSKGRVVLEFVSLIS
ncbi:hypothetical protein SASPL_157717 [Salvia splendens]|uniref:FHA domain-containing protein n=1 Tax=Salvia splendens TaxID=180675 RepID=A0A8X8YVZ7_SALSN|nr:hypothetical protein SASPL_157717 [Salvia splendens]